MSLFEWAFTLERQKSWWVRSADRYALPLPVHVCKLFVARLRSARPYGVTLTFLDLWPAPAPLMTFTRYT